MDSGRETFLMYMNKNLKMKLGSRFKEALVKASQACHLNRKRCYLNFDFVQIQNLLYLFYPGRLSSVSVVKEEKSYSKEDVNDGGDEWEVQQQAGEVFDARTSFGDQVDEE